MNRLSEYIRGMKDTRELLKEARIKLDEGKDRLALRHTIDALDSFIRTTSCVVSIRDKVKVRKPKYGVKP